MSPTIGLAGGKFPAGAAATLADPNNALCLTAGEEARFLAPLPVEWLPVRPEAYFCYRVGERRSHCFLEADLGTEANRRFRQKVSAYIAYRESGRYRERYGPYAFRSRYTRGISDSSSVVRHTLDVTEERSGDAESLTPISLWL
jgi:hypothetical protein